MHPSICVSHSNAPCCKHFTNAEPNNFILESYSKRRAAAHVFITDLDQTVEVCGLMGGRLDAGSSITSQLCCCFLQPKINS